MLIYCIPGLARADFLSRQASEQYLIDSQFFSHALRQVISLPQARHNLLGKKDLFPLNPDFFDLLILAH
jgi:hypothetical protein